MSIRLFRHTGYSSILLPGEARLAPHPAWLVAGVSGWVGLVCNVALWQSAFGGDPVGALRALALGLLVAGAITTVLSVLCWRRTLKPAASALLVLAAAAASNLWIHGVPTGPQLLPIESGLLLPGWASLMGWPVPLMMILLGLMPTLVIWRIPLRRLAGPAQFHANVTSLTVGISVMAAGLLVAGLMNR